MTKREKGLCRWPGCQKEADIDLVFVKKHQSFYYCAKHFGNYIGYFHQQIMQDGDIDAKLIILEGADLYADDPTPHKKL